MADKDFKVKTGLDLPAPLPLAEGGTGQTSAENTRNALMPVQTGHSGKFITTDGTGMSWAVAPQQTATDGAAGYKVYAGNTAPTGQSTGDIWIDGSTGNGIQLVRWRKTIAATTTTLSALDDNNLTLSYTAGNEQVYINGTLITRGQDYTATNGTSVVLTQSAEVGDTVEIFGNPLFSVTDVYTQEQANSLYVRNSNYPVAGKNKIINGDFSNWQRGISFTNPAILAYTADRYFTLNNGTSTTVIVSQESLLPNTIAGYNSDYYFRYNQTAAGTGASLTFPFAQRIENAKTFAGQTVTFSLWVKSDSARSFALNIAYNLGTGGSAAPAVSTSATKTSATTWERHTFTTTLPTLSGLTVGAGSFISVYLSAPVNVVQTWDIWGVQFEAGSVPTSFSTSTGTIQGELAACQRYFERVGQNSYSPYGTGLCGSSTTARVNVTCQPKRANVSVSYGAANTFEVWNSTFAGVSVASISSVAVNKSQVNVGITVASGLVAGNSTTLIDGGTGNSYIDFSAEL